jgi:hypothetical protein
MGFRPTPPSGGGSIFSQALTATATAAGSITNQVNKIVTVALPAVSATMVRTVNKLVSVTLPAATASITKRVNKTLVATTMLVTASLLAQKVILLALTATATVTASIVKRVNKAVTATTSLVTASLVKLVNKTLVATTVPVTASLTALRVILLTLTATTVTVAASLTKQVNKLLSVSLPAVAASLVKQVNKIVLAGGIGGNDANTVLLLHCDGTNGSTTFTDSSPSGHTMTAVGGATISTALSVFGGASANLPSASTSGITTPDASDLDLGSGDFTIDFRVNFASTTTDMDLIGQCDNPFAPVDCAWRIIRTNFNNSLYFQFSTNGTSATSFLKSWTPSTSTWYHVAIVRSGSNLYHFVDGTQLGTTSTISGTAWNSTVPLCIGFVDAVNKINPFNGNVDEVRVSKVARWTSNFTPPPSAYGNAGGVNLAATITAIKVILLTLTATTVTVTASVTKRVNKLISVTLPAATATLVKRVNKNMTATTATVTASVTKSIGKIITSAGNIVTGLLNAILGPTLPGAITNPVVSGNPMVGNVLSSTTGTWSHSPDSYAYIWQRNFGGAWVTIPGATGATYTLTQADVNATIRSEVTATNVQGSKSADSNSLGPVGINYNRVVTYV